MRTLALITEPGSAPALVAVGRAVASGDDLLLVATLSPGSGEQMVDVQRLARARRKELDELATAGVRTAVIGAEHVWDALRDLVTNERIELIVAAWSDAEAGNLGAPTRQVLSDPPSAVMLVKGDFNSARRVLVPIRGGGYAELAATIGRAICRQQGGQLTRLHVIEPGSLERGLPPLLRTSNDEGIDLHMVKMVGEPLDSILAELAMHDAIILGATGRDVPDPLGPVGHALFEAVETAAVVRTKAPVDPKTFGTVPPETVERRERDKSVGDRVDRWFVSNTFASAEFANLGRLVAAKERQKLRISVALPTLNEEATIRPIIRSIRSHLMDRHQLVDELVLIDSRSNDSTRAIATDEGIPVYIHDEIMASAGSRTGKGEAMWKSLHVVTGDLVVWVDTDISNFHPKFVYGILGPLLLRPEISYVKAFYRRPLRAGAALEPDGGGRVTELTARPMFNLFFPELSGFIQPLSGEQGGRRGLLDQLPFFTGYGVETGLLIDILKTAGLEAMAQVDMKQRIHRNQSLYALSQMSFRIVQVVAKRLGESAGHPLWEDANRSLKLWSEGRDGHLRLEVKEIEIEERPPISSFTDYDTRAAIGRPAFEGFRGRR